MEKALVDDVLKELAVSIFRDKVSRERECLGYTDG
jgi:hypothetical protein